MSTEQYPEVSSEDSGLVPQAAPKVEWPKKIRTLTAVELDRLTIDGDGRFYWDGRLVNYQPPEGKPQDDAMEHKPEDAKSAQSMDLDALALLDRAALEISDRKPAEQPPAASDAQPHSETVHAVETAAAVEPAATTDEVKPAEPLAPSVAPVPVVDSRPATVRTVEAPLHMPSDRLRIKLSFWQSLALIVVLVGFVIGALGVAASGLVAMHEWGCRSGWVTSYCPAPPPAPKPAPRVDIPA
jgi:hypothetical protein